VKFGSVSLSGGQLERNEARRRLEIPGVGNMGFCLVASLV
jgi:hypothetical protein